MNQTIALGKRAFVIAVAAATILSMAGLSAFVAPLTASAASAGDLIKGTTLSTVYYYAADGMRYAFPNEKSYFTWYSDFSGVQTLTDSELAAIPLAGNIVYRPGSRWIKIQSDPKTYAVTPQGVIRWIETEAVATGLAGASWNTFIDDVPDVFFVDYSVGPSLVSAAGGYNGMLLEGSTYLLWDGQKRMVTDAGFSANRYQDRFVLPAPGVDLDAIPAGSNLSSAEAELTDTAQTGAVATGGLSVSLASDTPASQTVPGGADSVKFTKVKLMASSGSANVDSMKFKLGGVGSTSNIDDAYLYDGNIRITDGRSINSSTRSVTFGALNMSLTSGMMKHLTVRADTSTAAAGGDTANFGLMSASSISSSATVSGNFPVVGNTMTFSDTDAGTIEVSKTGSISDPVLGEKDAVIAKFTVEIDDEDGHLHEITLNVDDASDHSNFKLWDGADLLASCTSDGDDLVSCVLTNPLPLDEGDSETLELSADIGGDAGEDIKVAVEETADVVAVGSDFGFNLGVDIAAYDATGGACASSANDCSFSTTEGGELTFAFNGPPSDDIQIDGDDQVLMEFSITAENWVEVKELNVTVRCDAASASGCDAAADPGDLVNAAGTEANLQDITIRKSAGGTLMGPEELAVGGSDTSQSLEFDDNFIMMGGDSLDLMVTVDIDNDAVADDIYQVLLELGTAGDVDAEDQNGDALALSDIVPSADLSGNLFTLANASLDVTPATPPSSGTYVKGTSNVPVVGYAWEAGDTSDVTVTDVTFQSTGDTDATFTGGTSEDDVDVGDHVGSCTLYDSETSAVIAGPEGLDSTDQILFDSFDWTIPAGETMKTITKCNFSNNDLDGADADAYAFFIDSDEAGDIVAEDEDGDSVTETTTGPTGVADVTAVPEIDIVDSGTINVTIDGSTPKANVLLSNSTGVNVAKYKFDAVDEDFLVKKLTFVNCLRYDGDNNCTDDFTSGAALDEANGQDRVAKAVKLSYKDKAGTTKTKTGFLSGNKVNFSSLDFFVPDAETRVLTVSIDTNAVTSQAATSGDQLGLHIVDSGTFTFTAPVAAATASFEAVGDGSGETVLDFGGTGGTAEGVAARRFVIHKTKPTLSLAAGSPSGAGVPGLSEVLRLNVSADSRGFVTLDLLTFKVSFAEATAAGFADCDPADLAQAAKWEFYDLDEPGELLDDDGDWSWFESDGTACAGAVTDNIGYAVLDFEGSATTPSEEVGAGETKTYVLRIDTTGASSSSDDSIRVDIPSQSELCDDDATTNDPTINATNNTLAASGDGTCDGGVEGVDLGGDDVDDPAVKWDDDVEGDDIEGDFLKNLPLVGGTIVY